VLQEQQCRFFARQHQWTESLTEKARFDCQNAEELQEHPSAQLECLYRQDVSEPGAAIFGPVGASVPQKLQASFWPQR
jgi:hypothetical protein